MRHKIFFICFTAMLLQPLAVYSKTISINTNTENDANELTVTLRNLGDEQANDVSIEVFDGTKKHASESPSVVGAGKSLIENFQLDQLPGPGTHVGRILINYRDGGGYLFSAPNIFTRRSETSATSRLSLKLEAPKLTGQTGKLVLINTEKVPATVNVEFFTANELKFVPESARETLEPGKSAEIEFKILNVSALNMSRYPFFTIASYEIDNTKYTAIGKSVVAVRQTSTKYKILSFVLAGIVCLGAFNIVRKMIR